MSSNLINQLQALNCASILTVYKHINSLYHFRINPDFSVFCPKQVNLTNHCRMASYANAEEELRIAEIFYQKAQLQVYLLHEKWSELARRLDRMERDDDHPLQYLLRTRLDIISQVMRMYSDYAELKEQQIVDLQRELTQMNLEQYVLNEIRNIRYEMSDDCIDN